jgi:hypothetical protein
MDGFEIQVTVNGNEAEALEITCPAKSKCKGNTIFKGFSRKLSYAGCENQSKETREKSWQAH